MLEMVLDASRANGEAEAEVMTGLAPSSSTPMADRCCIAVYGAG